MLLNNTRIIQTGTIIFKEIFSHIIYTEKEFIDVWQSSLTYLYGMLDDFSPIEKIIFHHFPFHDSFLLLHKILLSNQVNEEAASRHLSHLFMDLSSNDKLEVIRFLSLRKYQNSARFYAKILKSDIPELIPSNNANTGPSHQKIDDSPNWDFLYDQAETIQSIKSDLIES